MKKCVSVRLTALCAALCTALCLCACAAQTGAPQATPQPAAMPEAAPTVVAAEPSRISDAFNPTQHLIGFVLQNDGGMDAYTQMHGFLRTAESLNYAAKLFTYEGGMGAMTAVKQAAAEGCEALLFYDPEGYSQQAIALARESGMLTGVSYYPSDAETDISVVADDSEYIREVAMGIAQRMQERSLKSGRILLYGTNPAPYYESFKAAIDESYGYGVVTFAAVATDSAGAAEELAQYILNNRDIKGLFCTDERSTAIAVTARSLAQKYFKGATPTPKLKPTPTPTPDLVNTPVPSALLKEILITVFGTGISEANMELISDNDIYGVVAEPYYDCAAQATMLMDKLMRGETVSADVRVNVPIARAETIDRYLAAYDQTREWFDLGKN